MSKLLSSSLSRRSFLTKSAVAAASVIGTGTLLEACGAAASGTKTSTITVMYLTNELSDKQVAAFQALNPDITVKYVQYDPIRLSASLAAGNPPDFIRTFGAAEMPNIIARGLAAPVDAYFANSSVLKVSDLQPVNSVYQFANKQSGQGARYGMAKDWSPDFQMWYNKKVFDQANVTPPSSTTPLSFDDLIDLGKSLTVTENGKIKVYGLDVQWGFQHQGRIIQMVAQQGGSLYNDDLSKVDFTTPEARKAVKFYVDWALAHIGPSPLDPDPGGWSWPPFDADRLGIATYGFWFGGQINTDSKLYDHIGFLPAAVMGPTRISACMTGTGAWIPNVSKNKDAAWKFMEYFMGGQPAIDRAKTGFGVPALTSLASDIPQSLPYQQQAYTTLQAELSYVKPLRFSPYISDDAFNNAFTKIVEPVMHGAATLDSAIGQLNDTINLLLSQGQEQIG